MNNPEDVKRLNELDVNLEERMHAADYLVVTHADPTARHLDNHIYVQSHDNLAGKSLQRNTSWKDGSYQTNHELMRAESCRVLLSPEQRLGWTGPSTGRTLQSAGSRTRRGCRPLSILDDMKDEQQEAESRTVKKEQKALPLTSQPSAGTSRQIERVENRLSESAQSLDGKRLRSASQSLIAAGQKNHAGTASAVEKLRAQADESKTLVSKVGGTVQRIERHTDERVKRVVEQVAGEASAVVTANIDTANERAERVTDIAAKIEARQLWTSFGALALVLLPFVGTVFGLVIVAWGVVYGWEVAVASEAETWLRWVKGIGAVFGTAGGLLALGLLLRQTTAVIVSWMDRRPRSMADCWRWSSKP